MWKLSSITSRLSQRPRYVLVAAVLCIGPMAVLVYSGVHASAPHDAKPSTAAGVAALNVDQAPNFEFVTAPPPAIQPASYHQVATAMTQTGQPVRLFTGTLKDNGVGCFGLRTPDVIGIACGADLSGGVALQAHETTYHGYRMVSGLVSPQVESLIVTNLGGHDVPVTIHNGTFFFDGRRGNSLRAYDQAGQLVGSYELEP
jgi:hypothetical protein